MFYPLNPLDQAPIDRKDSCRVPSPQPSNRARKQQQPQIQLPPLLVSMVIMLVPVWKLPVMEQSNGFRFSKRRFKPSHLSRLLLPAQTISWHLGLRRTIPVRRRRWNPPDWSGAERAQTR
jgi:hypothetical protein